MTPADLKDLEPPTGPIRGTGLSVSKSGETYQVAKGEEPQDALKLDMVFGSGKTGVTYAGVRGRDTLVEARMSYFPHRKSWEITPGQEQENAASIGKTHQGEFPRQCVLCHAVTLPKDSLIPERKFYGVGCESCHGPGGAHVEAMRAGGKNALFMEKIGSWDAGRINEMCGKCHTANQQMVSMNSQADDTHRFQAYGLMRSECFLRSQNTLSCLNCHDPHTDVRTDARHYERACLQCHSPTATQSAKAPAVTNTPCPVNATGKCIGCHMPSRKVFRDSKIPTKMADHFIRVLMADGKLPRRTD